MRGLVLSAGAIGENRLADRAGERRGEAAEGPVGQGGQKGKGPRRGEDVGRHGREGRPRPTVMAIVPRHISRPPVGSTRAATTGGPRSPPAAAVPLDSGATAPTAPDKSAEAGIRGGRLKAATPTRRCGVWPGKVGGIRRGAGAIGGRRAGTGSRLTRSMAGETAKIAYGRPGVHRRP
ncbi:hypothetical protein KPB2_5517 [Klebsiella pneumoniae Kb677]|nr:hypothetical protein KPB2_5517 [Klebsiella pneumoniae Kb677]